MVQRDEIFSCKYWQAIVRAGLTPFPAMACISKGRRRPFIFFGFDFEFEVS